MAKLSEAAIYHPPEIVNGVNGQPLHTAGGSSIEDKDTESKGVEGQVHVTCFLPQTQLPELVPSRTSSPAPATLQPAMSSIPAKPGRKRSTPPSVLPPLEDAGVATAGKNQKLKAKASSLPPEPKKGHAMKGAAELHAGERASSQQKGTPPAAGAKPTKKAAEKAGGGQKKVGGGHKAAGGKARKGTPPVQAEGQKAKEAKKKQHSQLQPQQGKRRKESPPKNSKALPKATKTNRALHPGLVRNQEVAKFHQKQAEHVNSVHFERRLSLMAGFYKVLLFSIQLQIKHACMIEPGFRA